MSGPSDSTSQRASSPRRSAGPSGHGKGTSFHLMNLAFHAVHLSVIGFTLTGWIWPRARVAHLGLILLMLGSWFILGRWMGAGYCPITDWHFRFRRRMGAERPSGPYIKLVLDRLTGRDLDRARIDRATLVITLALGTVSLVLTILDRLW